MFLLDRAFALKIYSPFWDEFELEGRLLKGLSSEEQIPVSELVGCGRVADGAGVLWAYVITRYCEARPFTEIRQDLPSATPRRWRRNWAESCGGFIRSMPAGLPTPRLRGRGTMS